MTATRLQHIVPAGIVLGVALIVVWVSFTQEPAAAFLFPRIVSVVFVALAVWNFARAALGMAKVGGGIEGTTALQILPGFIVTAALVFFAAKTLGFYVACTLAFFIMLSLYDPAPHGNVGTWARRIAVTAIFMGVIYLLFATLLQVQTPRGMFI